MEIFQDFLYIMDFNGNQTVQRPNESFSAVSKGFKQHHQWRKKDMDILDDMEWGKLSAKLI